MLHYHLGGICNLNSTAARARRRLLSSIPFDKRKAAIDEMAAICQRATDEIVALQKPHREAINKLENKYREECVAVLRQRDRDRQAVLERFTKEEREILREELVTV